MNKVKLTSFICGTVLSLTGTSLLAQQSSSSGTSTSSGASSSSSTPNPGGQETGSSTFDSGSSSRYGSSSGHWQHSGPSVRLSNLMNASVQSQEGKSIGSIRDFTIDPQSGHVQFAILSLSPSGGAAETSTSGHETVPSSRSSVIGTPSSAIGSTMTGKLIPVPWQLFSHSWQNGSSAAVGTSAAGGTHNLVLNIDESKLESAPSFDASNWNEMEQSSFDQRVYSYYGVNRMSGAGTSGSSISGQGTSSTDQNDGRIHGAQGTSSHDYGTGTATGGTGAKGGASDLENKSK